MHQLGREGVDDVAAAHLAGVPGDQREPGGAAVDDDVAAPASRHWPRSPGCVPPPPHALATSASEVTAAPASKRVLARMSFLLRKFASIDAISAKHVGFSAREWGPF